MTKLLTQAFEKASELPEDLQDQLAADLPIRSLMTSRRDTRYYLGLSRPGNMAHPNLAGRGGQGVLQGRM